MRLTRSWLVFLLAIALAVPLSVLAKGGGGGFSGGSRSSSFSSSRSSGGWSGGSRPSVSMGSVSKPSAPSFTGGTRTSSAAVPSGTISTRSLAGKDTGSGFTGGSRGPSTGSAPTSAFAQRSQAHATEITSRTAYKDFKAQQQAKLATTSSPRPAADYSRYRSDPVMGRIGTDDYRTAYSRKQAIFGDYYSHPPIVVVNSGYSSMGMWDALALSWMFDHQQAQLAAMMYNRPDDAGLQQYRNELAKQAETNAELKAKLAALDATVSGQKGPRNAAYVPEGVDPSVLVAPEALDATKPVLRLCTGRPDGNYYYVGNEIAGNSDDITVQVVQTEGSFDNLSKLGTECDAALVQRDAYWVYADDKGLKGSLPWDRVWSPYDEYGLLACTTKSGIEDLSQLTAKNTVYIGTEGSGSYMTWHSWISETPSYAKVRAVTEGGNTAAAKLLNGEGDCMLYVSGLNSPFMRDVSTRYGSKLVLASIKSSGLKAVKDPAGDEMYRFVSFPSSVYPNLKQTSSGCSFFKTVVVSADLVVSQAWKSTNAKVYDAAVGDFMAVADEIHTRFNP